MVDDQTGQKAFFQETKIDTPDKSWGIYIL